jgi:hypothetical protein
MHLALATVVALACPAARADGPPEPGGIAITVLQGTDSARVAVSWTAGPLAQNQLPVASWQTALVTVAGDTVAAGTTTGTRDTLAVAWPPVPDSLRVFAAVRAVDTQGTRGAWGSSSVVTLKLVPAPPSAPDVQIDTVTGRPQAMGARVVPDSLRLAIGEGGVLCAFKLFTTGRAALRSSDRDACEAAYLAAVPVGLRATAVEQAWEDAQCWTWTSSSPLAAAVTPAGPCRASATVQGLQLTGAPMVRDAVRYAAAGERPLGGVVATVDRDGVATCRQPGRAVVTAAVDGVTSFTLLACTGPYAGLFRAD